MKFEVVTVAIRMHGEDTKLAAARDGVVPEEATKRVLDLGERKETGTRISGFILGIPYRG